MKQYLELHLLSEPPKKDGIYDIIEIKSGLIETSVPWYNKEGWGIEARYATHWISHEPVTGVLVSEEELKQIIVGLQYGKEFSPLEEDEALDNLINSLTNKANQ